MSSAEERPRPRGLRGPIPRTAAGGPPAAARSAALCDYPGVRRRQSHRKAFTLVEAVVLAAVLLLLVALAVPGLAHLRRKARQAQNATQLRGITHGMFNHANSSKNGGRDGWYPGITSTGETIPVGDVVPAVDLMATADVPGYAAAPSPDVLPSEMNGPAGRGFIVRAMAELAAGDFVSMSSPAAFVNPADVVKTPFVPGDPGPAGRFTAAGISYTTLDLSKSDGGRFPFKSTWKEDADPRAVLLADRAVGDGSDPAARSSVWTRPGSGDWEGAVAFHDGSASHLGGVGAMLYAGTYDGLGFSGGALGGPFDPGLTILASPPSLSFGSGLLYDEADPGADPAAF